MPQQTGRRVVEVLVVNQHLLHYLIIGVLAVTKHLTVPREKRQRHKYAVGPQLPCPARNVRVPEATVLCPRVRIENSTDVFRGKLVFFLLRFLVKNQQQKKYKLAAEN